MNPRWIEIDEPGGGRQPAYVSLPPAGSGPGLVLYPEIFGINRHIRAVADQYALDGFVVLVPDLFWRDAPGVELGYDGADRDRALALMKAADPQQLAADAPRAVQALRALPECGPRAGAIGFCLGGRLAYLAAATGGLDATACFYGGGIQDQLTHATAVNGPIQFHYGAQDAAIPPAAVEKVRETFAVRADAEIWVYPDAGHGFNCWDRSSYHAPSAALAHARALTLFARALHDAAG